MSSITVSSRGRMLMEVLLVFLFLDIVAVGARFYARFIKRRRLGVSDYLIAVGLIFCMATIGVGCALVLAGGAGLHTTEVTKRQITITLKLFIPASIVWSTAITCVKLSILFFYLDVFEWPGFRPATYVVMTASVALWVAVLLESFLLCRPFAYNWDTSIHGVCGDSFGAYLSSAAVNLAIDLTIFLLPMPILWRLEMSWQKKAAISGILGLGLVCCVMSALRIDAVLSLVASDFTYTVIPDLIYAGLEVELAIINACLPILQPVFRRHFGPDGVFSRLITRRSTGDRSDNSDRWQRSSNKGHFNKMRKKHDPYALPTTDNTAISVADSTFERHAMDPLAIEVTTDYAVSHDDTKQSWSSDKTST